MSTSSQCTYKDFGDFGIQNVANAINLSESEPHSTEMRIFDEGKHIVKCTTDYDTLCFFEASIFNFPFDGQELVVKIRPHKIACNKLLLVDKLHLFPTCGEYDPSLYPLGMKATAAVNPSAYTSQPSGLQVIGEAEQVDNPLEPQGATKQVV